MSALTQQQIDMRAANAGGGTGGRIIVVPLAALASTQLAATGSCAYLVIATASVNMRADSNDFNPYYQGTGLSSVLPFTMITLQNPNNFPIAIALWVGYDSYIDRRLILNTFSQPNVVKPLVKIPGTVGYVDIPDLSGTVFADINGNSWIAIQRVQILISNVDTVNLALLQNFGNTVFNTGSIFAIQPLTEIGLNVQGSYTLVQNGGTLNCIVSEVYSAIPNPI